MQTLRTPDKQFAALPGYDFAPNYVEVSDHDGGSLRVHYLDDSYKAGARIFPSLVPTRPDDPAAEANKAAWGVFTQWHKPFVCCFSDSDPVTAGGDKPFLTLVPGTTDQPHATIENAGHFFQEDAAPQLAQLLIDVIGS